MKAAKKSPPFSGVDVGAEEKVVARLACAGGINVSGSAPTTKDTTTCRGAALVGGGGKSCSGDVSVSAIVKWFAISTPSPWTSMTYRLSSKTSVRPAATASKFAPRICSPCTRSAIDSGWPARTWKRGDEILEDCEVACTACGRCAMDAPGDLIVMENNLPVIDYTQNHNTEKANPALPNGRHRLAERRRTRVRARNQEGTQETAPTRFGDVITAAEAQRLYQGK